MEQLIQVRVLLQVDMERVFSALPHIIQLLYPQDIPKHGITIDELLDTIVIYQKTKASSSAIIRCINAVVEQYNVVQHNIADWKPGEASIHAVRLEEALYALDDAIAMLDGENYVK